MWKIIIIFICLGILFYILYMQGFMVINTKRAVMFVGSIRGKSNCKAKFTMCSGSMKRVIRFEESRAYNFSLKHELQNGKMAVNILDSSKQPMITLDSNNIKARLNADKKQRYYLVFLFKSATGSYELSWE
ncbi:MAG: hypothetical protein J1F63_08605 [Oscillospiraceae bacterium]|nr:hypothetical protein [Oscillospiraceae bacterium]